MGHREYLWRKLKILHFLPAKKVRPLAKAQLRDLDLPFGVSAYAIHRQRMLHTAGEGI